MAEFLPSEYEIVHDGQTVTRAVFSSCPEILGFIARRFSEGIYRVYRLGPTAMRYRPGKVFWAEVTNHGGQCVTFRHDPPH